MAPPGIRNAQLHKAMLLSELEILATLPMGYIGNDHTKLFPKMHIILSICLFPECNFRKLAQSADIDKA